MDPARALARLDEDVIACRACSRLVAWCQQVALEKRAAFREQTYWGRPLPGFGDARARILIVGLAPAAHGANRTGRMFTGDESGRWLYRALHKAGLANRAESSGRGDRLELCSARITAAARCAPPGNRPTPEELLRCQPFLAREIEACAEANVLLCLGGIAWKSAFDALAALGHARPRPLPKFAHGAECAHAGRTLLGCYHPSQQNTFTGRLTEPMLDQVLARAAELAGLAAARGTAAKKLPGRASSDRTPSARKQG